MTKNSRSQKAEAAAAPARTDQRDLIVYIGQMSAQLADMASSADQYELAAMLHKAAEEAQVSVAQIDLDEP